MSKSGPFMAIVVTAMMLIVLLPFEGAGANYGKNVSGSAVDASFLGVAANDDVGWSEFESSRGDVNGDGIDDLLFGGAFVDNASTADAGAVYLVFGKHSGWAKNTPAKNADVTFIGEMASDAISEAISIAGDINGDGYDDILISTISTNTSAGRTYLIFGKAAGWVPKFYLANATASIEGESANDMNGYAAGGVGDVNGDGLDDFYVGSAYRNQPGTGNGRVYLFFGKTTGWTKKMSPLKCDASFYAKDGAHLAGDLVGAGDINGDGLDDLVMGADGYNGTGKAYIMFGKKAGWVKDVNLETKSDASVVGEVATTGNFGYGISLSGDLNGDGIQDLVIGAGWNNQVGSSAGKVYVFFGKVAGWGKNVSAANADATFLGEAANDVAGYGLNAGGDLNGDGIDDMVIGASGNSQVASSAGKAYVILGKKAGWAKDVSLSTADASFLGEAANHQFGITTLLLGDINGDGFDDMAIGANNANNGGLAGAGKMYVVFFDTNKPPTPVTSVKLYASADFTNETAFALPGDRIYVELRGTDNNASRKDIAVVRLTSTANPVGFNLRLYETAVSSGIYRNSFALWDRTREDAGWIEASVGESVKAASVTDPTKSATLTLGAIELMPKADLLTATEDMLYNVHYYLDNATMGGGITGNFESNASWLSMNETTQNLSGTPDNSQVGSFWVYFNISDAFGRYVTRNFTVVVANTPPVINTTDVLTVDEDEYYEVDYNSTDDGQGTIIWGLETDASWLGINTTTGLLNGTPVNSNVGSWFVNVSVDDGNGGSDYTNFTLVVVNFLDHPSITTTDVTTATEGVKYQVDYEVTDVDMDDDVFAWSLKTDAKFLKINATSGILNGTPANADVGSHYVNVTVKDHDGLSDFHNFTLTVANVNDPPTWTVVPPAEVKINSLQTYTFDANATDIDVGDKLVYGVVITPSTTKVTINATTGVFTIGPLDAGVYSVNLSVTDSVARINSIFKLNVTHKNSPPTATLIGPLAGATVTTAKPVLQWSTADKDGDAVSVDVYFSSTESSVTTKAAAAKVVSASKTTSYARTTYLVPGTKYYWTVIPFDGNDTGACLNGTFNFTVSATAKVNHAPTISPPAKVPDATATKDYKLTVTGADTDAGTTFTYSLTGAPAGMSISNAGVITWKPTKDQAKTGTFTFNVVVSDGEFSASTPITVKVKKAPETGLGAMMIPLLLIVIIVIVIIVILALSMRKAPKDEDEEEEGDEEEVDEEE